MDMDMIAWLDECYDANIATTPPPLPFEIISKILNMRMLEKRTDRHKNAFNNVIDCLSSHLAPDFNTNILFAVGGDIFIVDLCLVEDDERIEEYS
tara:strand:- start:146 stop:430 length:285 start_codon:yes stop_codon:yes gene_type:complete